MMKNKLVPIALLIGFVVLVGSVYIKQVNSKKENTIPSTPIEISFHQLTRKLSSNKTEYFIDEEIVINYIILNNFSYPVKFRPPGSFDASIQSKYDPDNKVSQGINITWAEPEIELQAKTSSIITSFRFRKNTPGFYEIRVDGLPLYAVDVISPTS
jgi:hypothetical protein